MTYTVTIQLSETTFEQLKRAAELSQKPVDEIVESSLAHSLPHCWKTSRPRISPMSTPCSR